MQYCRHVIRDDNKTRTRWGLDPQTRIDWGIPELTGDGDGDEKSPNYETGDGDNINPRPRRKIPESPWGSPIPIGDGDGDVNRFPDGDGDGDGDEAEKRGWGCQSLSFFIDINARDQMQSDAVYEVSCILGCTRSSLNVLGAEKGVVVERVGDMSSDALFILLVEKDAAYMRLFLRKMKMELKLPVLALVDSDTYGLKILSVYGCGSKNMSYDSANLTMPDIKCFLTKRF
ncbi:DNA topoisomerase 6 subunit A [Tanacetum coccineum]